MSRIFKFLLFIEIILLTRTTSGQQSHKPIVQPNWHILEDKPLMSIKEGNRQVDVFKVKHPRPKALDYAWASCESWGDSCIVIIWIRGIFEDTRLIFNGKKINGLCTVYILKSDFEQFFRYCALSGVKSADNNNFVASFGGGPPGDREEYWFEWSDNVRPEFYCILK